MRQLEPPFPSIDLVLSKAGHDASRLPSYRSSYLARYHPYPQTRRHATDKFMRTVDYRFSDESLENPSPQLEPVGGVQAEAERDIENLDMALNAVPGIKRRRRLSALVVVSCFLSQCLPSTFSSSPGSCIGC
ncbi:hypothetical protein OBBRIDRAFT_40048 [Obba rivulosa]|uniref:Uncharacterized protein n=1 Tax=Obba rivulosa TaxID=1052685 RepID=A0A8E2AVX4_9APHY|nr:hypothetical protein OBBRIDRAFT_40048 [Obba rivulosa]